MMNETRRVPLFSSSPWSRFLLRVCLIWVLASGGVMAQTAKPITREGLEKALRLGGLKTSELITQVKRRGVDFPLSAETQSELARVGAAQPLLDAIAENYRGTAASTSAQPISQPGLQPGSSFKPVPAKPVAAVPLYPSVPGVYLRSNAEWRPLHQESVEWRKEGLMKNLKKVSGGLMDLEATGQVAGEHSVTLTRSPASLLICPERGLTVTDYMIVHLHGKHDNREFKISVSKLHSVDEVQILPHQVGVNAFEANFAQGDGDYAILSRRPDSSESAESGQSVFLYTFQVLP